MQLKAGPCVVTRTLTRYPPWLQLIHKCCTCVYITCFATQALVYTKDVVFVLIYLKCMHVLVETSVYVACYSHWGISMYVLWLHKVTAFLVLFKWIEWNFRTLSPKPLKSCKQAALNQSHVLTQTICCTCHHHQVPINLRTLLTYLEWFLMPGEDIVKDHTLLHCNDFHSCNY